MENVERMTIYLPVAGDLYLYIKIYINIAPTCFGLTTILREHIIDLS